MAAGQGHVYAMQTLGSVHRERKDYEQAVAWYTKAAEARLPEAMYDLAVQLNTGQGVAAPDYPAAAAGVYTCHFSAQLEPCLTQIVTLHTLDTP